MAALGADTGPSVAEAGASAGPREQGQGEGAEGEAGGASGAGGGAGAMPEDRHSVTGHSGTGQRRWKFSSGQAMGAAPGSMSLLGSP